MDWLIRVLGVARSAKDAMKGDNTSTTPDRSRESDQTTAKCEAIELVPPGLISQNFDSEDNMKNRSQSQRRQYRLSNRKLDRDAVDVVRRLRRHDHAAYLVGGCVRDLYLGLSPKDFDVSTSAKPEEIKRIFRNSRIIGRRFRLAHIYFRGGKVIETATFRGSASRTDDIDEMDQDLLITRDNVWGTEIEDALRRDFTINGLMYDTSKGEIIDHVGGLPDLDAKKIRTIGEPNIRIQEDPIRILRAIRFSSKLDFEIEEGLKQAIKLYGKEINRCAKARVLEETFKLFRTGNGAKSVEILQSTEVLGVVLPQLLPYFRGQYNDKATGNVDNVATYLHALDKLIQERGQVSDAVILTTLLIFPVQTALCDLEPRLYGQQLTSIIFELTEHMMLTRKIKERTRQILLAQKHLRKTEPGKRIRRRISPRAMLKRSYFADALDFLEIWSISHDEEQDQVTTWRKRAGELESDGASSEERETAHAKKKAPRKRRRRRREPGKNNKRESRNPEN